jgi:hypothetical protein
MLSALIVGALTAWYLGLKVGLIAAGISFVAIVVAGVVPGMTLTVYALIVGWCALLWFFGSKMTGKAAPSTSKAGVAGVAGSAIGTVGRWVGKARKMFGNDGR